MICLLFIELVVLDGNPNSQRGAKKIRRILDKFWADHGQKQFKTTGISQYCWDL